MARRQHLFGGGLPRLALSLLATLAVALGLVVGLAPREALADPVTWDSDITINTSDTITDGVDVTADITVTIEKDVELTVNGGIDATGHTLTVAGEGSLVVIGVAGANGVTPNTVSLDGQRADPGGVGGDGGAGIVGALVVDGASVTVTGGTGGRGDDGGRNTSDNGLGGDGGVAVDGSVTVNGGTFFATGGEGVFAL